MRPNLIFSLLSFAGSIVLAILATEITQYEGWFWTAAAFCVIAAIGVWAEPMVSVWLGRAKPQPSLDAAVYPSTQSAKSLPIEYDVWLRDAIWRAYIGIWYVPPEGLGQNISESEKQRFAMLIIREFRQLAFDGKLPIWGRRKNSTIWQEVPQGFWSDNQIDYIRIAAGDAPDQVMAKADNPWKKPDTSGDWHHFMTSKVVIERLYPGPQ
jgi:hypothetical protein